MKIPLLGLWILVMSVGTNGFIETTVYRSVFVPKKDVIWEGNKPAKSSLECVEFYRKQPESIFSLFRFEKEDGICSRGEAKYDGEVNKLKTSSRMIGVMGRHQLLLGEQNDLMSLPTPYLILAYQGLYRVFFVLSTFCPL